MSAELLYLLAYYGGFLLVVLLLMAGVITWAAVRMSRLVPMEESPLGWMRLVVSFGALALLPLWILATAFVLYAEYEMQMEFILRAGLISAILVVEGAGVVVALALASRGVLHLTSYLQQQRAARRYDALVGDGGVLQEDAWERAVLEVAEE